MTSKQHRCVFVGNIPYDATEEQLIRICEEVGPVVSFRLVLDRETGKPKGYGFCEYRDEETALSARRNLQGYEINGRQLRVDFAENEKGSAERNREQGRGGPGLQVTEVQKQTPGPKAVRDPFLHQPIGLPAAASAAVAMAGMLGAPQVSLGVRNGGMPVGTDALSAHLAAMSRLQLYEVIFQMKNLIQQNQQQARQLLTAHPQLTKALHQAQIMLGLVRVPHMTGAPPPLSGHQSMPQLAAMQQQQQGQPQLPIGQLQQAHQPNQAVNIAPQMNQISQTLQFQPSAQPHQQLGVSAGMLLPSQPASSMQPPNTVLQRSQPQALPNVHHQPPLPQLPRPVLPPSPPQPQASQGATFQLPSGSQAPFQPPVMAHSNVGIPYPAINPPLPSQPPPQHALQMPRSGADTGGIGQPISAGVFAGPLNTTIGGGRGANLGGPNLSAPSMTWSQAPPLSGPTTSTTGLNIMTGPGLAKIGPPVIHQQGSGMPSQNQQQGQPQAQQQQAQVTLEPEQQKALLQQVMNLTADQINSLPLEQRQQVLQLQQAVRNQTI